MMKTTFGAAETVPAARHTASKMRGAVTEADSFEQEPTETTADIRA
jgi:hypothetical protein